jgi:hypothetical protein
MIELSPNNENDMKKSAKPTTLEEEEDDAAEDFATERKLLTTADRQQSADKNLPKSEKDEYMDQFECCGGVENDMEISVNGAPFENSESETSEPFGDEDPIPGKVEKTKPHKLAIQAASTI